MNPADAIRRSASPITAISDEPRIVAAFRAHAGALGIERPDGIEAWRLFPLKDGRFVVGYRFSGARRRAESGDLFDVYAEIGRDPAAVSVAGEVVLSGIDQVAFVLPNDPQLPRLQELIAGNAFAAVEAALAPPGVLVAYRPLSRATLRVRCVAGGEARLRVSASASRYHRIAARARAAASFAGVAGGPRFPRLHLELPSHNALLIEHLCGTPLNRRLGQVTESDLDAIAAALEALGRCDPAGLPPHHGIDEAERTAWMLRRAAAAHLEGDVDRLLVLLFDQAAELDVPPLVPIHRDLHDKQIVLNGESTAGLLDSDMLAAGDPALDVANLAVHFELRELQGELAPGAGERLARGFLATCAARRLSAAGPRLSFFSACAWLRLAGVYALRSRGRSLVPHLLARAHRQLTLS